MCVIYSISGNVFDKYELQSLTTKFVRCSVRTCVRHVEQLLRQRLHIPHHLTVQVICGDRILDDWVTLKQVWLSCWFTKVTFALCKDDIAVSAQLPHSTFQLVNSCIAVAALCWLALVLYLIFSPFYFQSVHRNTCIGKTSVPYKRVFSVTRLIATE